MNIKNLLKASDMPNWLSLILFVATAMLTYCISPAINEQFERQKIVSSYIIR